MTNNDFSFKNGRCRDPSDHIKKIFVEEDCLDHPYTGQILAGVRNIPVQTISSAAELSGLEEIFTGGGQEHYIKNLTAGKQHLLLSRNKGHFFKACPGTRQYRCCDYQVLNIGMNCPMDCVYCILQAYLNNPWLSFFVNTEDLFRELDEALAVHRFLRIGTGEFTDSMALDSITGLSRQLIAYFRDKQNAVLELKTKTAVIDNLADIDHNRRTVISWSLNSPPIMEREEIRTASLAMRLEAASQCAAMGYLLGFHFDPIIYHPGWQQGYAETIEKLFAAVPAENIVWISMGALRFLPPLKTIAAERFAASNFFYEEFITGLDNKCRYFRSLRTEMYHHVFNELTKRAHPETCIYFCMESDEIWQDVTGRSPEEQGGLPAMLDEAVQLAGKR